MLVFNLPEEKCRVIQTETGGAFGGKEDFPSRHRLARRAAGDEGRPAGEDLLRPQRGHGRRRRSGIHRARGIGRRVDKDGKLLACEIEFAIDGGAYVDALAGGALARHDPCRGPYSLAESARARQGDGDEYPAARGVSRVRRAAEHLRARAAHGQDRARWWASRRKRCAGATSSSKATDDGDRPGRQRRSRHAADARHARSQSQRLPRASASVSRTRMQARAIKRGDRLCGVHPRRWIHRIGRAAS